MKILILVGVLIMTTTSKVTAENTYEIVSFKYKDDISFNEQQTAIKKLNDIVSQFNGFVSREYYYSKELNRWFDFVTWESLEQAKNASEKAMTNAVAMEIFSLMDESSMIFSHYKKLGGVEKN